MFGRKKKYRVLEVTKGNGAIEFYTQQKGLFGWEFISNSHDDAIEFKTMDKANEFLFKRTMSERGDLVVKEKPHLFDEVFHKLKND